MNRVVDIGHGCPLHNDMGMVGELKLCRLLAAAGPTAPTYIFGQPPLISIKNFPPSYT